MRVPVRIHPTPRRGVLGFVLAAAALSVAPVAAAQELTVRVGAPIKYQIGLPEGAEIQCEQGALYAVAGDILIIVDASDMYEAYDGDARSRMSEAELRRMLTESVVNADSLHSREIADEDGSDLRDVVQEIRTLGGRRATFMRARERQNGRDGWFEVYITAKDGMHYVLMFMGAGSPRTADEPLLARIRDSFVLPR